MSDDTKRDLRPDASKQFIANLQRGMDAVMRRMQMATDAGANVGMVYCEHKATRGIRSLLLVVGP